MKRGGMQVGFLSHLFKGLTQLFLLLMRNLVVQTLLTGVVSPQGGLLTPRRSQIPH